MTNLFWYLRLTPSLTAVDMTQFTAEMPIAVLETGERGQYLSLQSLVPTCMFYLPTKGGNWW